MFCSQLPQIKPLSLLLIIEWMMALPLRCDFRIFLNHPGRSRPMTRHVLVFSKEKLWLGMADFGCSLVPFLNVISSCHDQNTSFRPSICSPLCPLASSLISLCQSLFWLSLQLDVDLCNRIWSFRKSSRKSFWYWRSRPWTARIFYKIGQTEDVYRCKEFRFKTYIPGSSAMVFHEYPTCQWKKNEKRQTRSYSLWTTPTRPTRPLGKLSKASRRRWASGRPKQSQVGCTPCHL